MKETQTHQSVLLQETIDGLDMKKGDIIVDATVNEAGQISAIAEQFKNSQLQIVGIDLDADVLKTAKLNLSATKVKFNLLEGNFRDLDKLLASIGIKQVNKIIMDLGWSYTHITLSGRGFSFQKDEPLLMTYSKKPNSNQQTAAEIINLSSEAELAKIFKDYGNERFSAQIAKSIIRTRQQKPITTTFQLVEVIKKAVPSSSLHQKAHFATKVFQALRIVVNDEFEALKEGLIKALDLLSRGGRLAVISFHSDEDRIVKFFFKDLAAKKLVLLVNKKAIKPSRAEILKNRRSRSAVLRIVEKL